MLDAIIIQSPFALVMLMPADPRAPDPTSARAEIRQLLNRQEAAWNRGDLEGFMDGYWQSPQLSFSSGPECFRGWQATLDRYRQRYQTNGREMGQLTLGDVEIEPLGRDSAFVRGRWQLTTSQESMTGLFTLILRKFPEGWRIAHDHTSA